MPQMPALGMLAPMKAHYLLISLAAGLLAACSSLPAPRHAPTVDSVVLLSIDGLNLGALGQGHSPHLDRLAAEGVQARWMTPSYPSITFPNHYSMVTGLRPDRHGIIHNQMEDVELGRFELRDLDALRKPGWWADARPIWLQASRAGLRSATLSYPGGEVAIDGQHADLWHPYDESLSPEQRAQMMLQWLSRSDRPHVLAGYFEHVDKAGHAYGPNSPEYAQAIRLVDQAVGALVDGLRERGQLDSTNLIIVSDHGMSEVADGNTVAVEDMIAPELARAVSVGQVIGFAPAADQLEQARQQLIGAHDHYDCWAREDLPERWHFGQHRRIPPILCQMHEGWDANTREVLGKRRPGVRGSHGYDNALPSMRSPFIAIGPAFRRHTVIEPINNVDIYPLLGRLLHIALPDSDGDAQATVEAMSP